LLRIADRPQALTNGRFGDSHWWDIVVAPAGMKVSSA
jgi:hypothetical protein